MPPSAHHFLFFQLTLSSTPAIAPEIHWSYLFVRAPHTSPPRPHCLLYWAQIVWVVMALFLCLQAWLPCPSPALSDLSLKSPSWLNRSLHLLFICTWNGYKTKILSHPNWPQMHVVHLNRGLAAAAWWASHMLAGLDDQVIPSLLSLNPSISLLFILSQ